MIYVFEDSDKLLHNNPDTYILSQKDKIIPWGDKLKVWSVYHQGQPTLTGYQEIYAMFSHEGSFGSLGDTQWIPSKTNFQSWYKGLYKGLDTNVVNSGKVVYFDLGNKYPKYFLTKEDLAWYITNIYNLYQPHVNDDFSD